MVTLARFIVYPVVTVAILALGLWQLGVILARYLRRFIA